jgi:signal transduction histidine kinase
LTDRQANSLKRRITRYSIALVLVVMFLQILLFAGWEFFAESQEEHTVNAQTTDTEVGMASETNLPFDHQLKELFILCIISAVTLPLFILLIRLFGNRIFKPIEEIAHTAERIGAGDTRLRLSENQSKDEISTLANTLNHAFDRYQNLLEKAEQFSADASHQLRTPLAVIRTSGELALTQAKSAEEYREVLSNVLEETERLEHIVEQLLLMTRLSASDPKAHFVRVDPAYIANQVADRFGPLLEDRGLSFELELCEGLLIDGNEALITEAVTNLTLNASNATERGGKVTLSTYKDAENIVLEVADTGCGIPTDDQPFIFNRFHRLSDNPASGSGLGLAIVQAIAEAHGATPEISSEVGVGSQFRLRFPPAGYLQEYTI